MTGSSLEPPVLFLGGAPAAAQHCASAWEESGLLSGEEIQCSLQSCGPQPPASREPRLEHHLSLPPVGSSRPAGRRGSAENAARTPKPEAAAPAAPAAAGLLTVIFPPLGGPSMCWSPCSAHPVLTTAPPWKPWTSPPFSEKTVRLRGVKPRAGQTWRAQDANPGRPDSHMARLFYSST